MVYFESEKLIFPVKKLSWNKRRVNCNMQLNIPEIYQTDLTCLVQVCDIQSNAVPKFLLKHENSGLLHCNQIAPCG